MKPVAPALESRESVSDLLDDVSASIDDRRDVEVKAWQATGSGSKL